MKRLKILIFTNLFPNPIQPLRGNFVANLVDAMKKHVDITVVSPLPWFPNVSSSRWNQDWHQYSKIPYFYQWNGFDAFYPKYLFFPILSRPLQPGLINLAVSGLVNKLVKRRGIDIINAHWIYPDGISAVHIGGRLKVPVVLTAHGSDINIYGSYMLRRPQIKWAFKRTKKVICVSNGLSQNLERNMGIDKDKITVIPNGVDTERFCLLSREEARRRLNLYKDKKYLLFVGRLHEIKGLRYLIESLSLLKNRGALFEAILIGSGSLKNDIQQWIQERALTKDIHLLGERPNEEIPLWMNACDAFCLPSLNEGNPCVILEALSCGLPVVASNVGGLPELINESNGILVEPENPVALEKALNDAFHRDWSKKEISNQIKNYSWKRSAESYIKVFEETLDSPIL